MGILCVEMDMSQAYALLVFLETKYSAQSCPCTIYLENYILYIIYHKLDRLIDNCRTSCLEVVHLKLFINSFDVKMISLATEEHCNMLLGKYSGKG